MPLILASLIKGVSDLKDLSRLSQMGLRTIITYVFTTLIAVSIGLLVVNAVAPGEQISEQTRNDLVEAYGGEAEKKKRQMMKRKMKQGEEKVRISACTWVQPMCYGVNDGNVGW